MVKLRPLGPVEEEDNTKPSSMVKLRPLGPVEEPITDAQLMREEGVVGNTLGNVAGGINRSVLANAPGTLGDVSAGLSNIIQESSEQPLFGPTEVAGQEFRASPVVVLGRLSSRAIDMASDFLVNNVENPIRRGLDLPEADSEALITEPFLGSEQINKHLENAGILQKPRTDREARLQKVGEVAGESALFGLGAVKMAGKEVLKTPVKDSTALTPISEAARQKPKEFVVAEAAAGAGSEQARQIAEERFPDSPYAQPIAQVLGGVGGAVSTSPKDLLALSPTVQAVKGAANKFLPELKVKETAEKVISKFIANKSLSEKVARTDIRKELMRAGGITDISDPVQAKRFEEIVSFYDNAINTGKYDLNDLKDIAPGVSTLETEAGITNPAFAENIINKKITSREQLEDEFRKGIRIESPALSDKPEVDLGNISREEIIKVQDKIDTKISEMYTNIIPEKNVKLPVKDVSNTIKSVDTQGFSSDVMNEINKIYGIKSKTDLVGFNVNKLEADFYDVLSLRSEVSKQIRQVRSSGIVDRDLERRLMQVKSSVQDSMKYLKDIDPEAYARLEVADSAKRAASDVFNTGAVSNILAKDPQGKFKMAAEDVVRNFVKENGKGKYQSFDDYLQVFDNETLGSFDKSTIQTAFKDHIRNDILESSVNKDSLGNVTIDPTKLKAFTDNNESTLVNLFDEDFVNNMRKTAEDFAAIDKDIKQFTKAIEEGTRLQADYPIFTPMMLASRTRAINQGYAGSTLFAAEGAIRSIFKRADKLSGVQRQKILEDVLTNPASAKLLLVDKAALGKMSKEQSVQYANKLNAYLTQLLGEDSIEPDQGGLQEELNNLGLDSIEGNSPTDEIEGGSSNDVLFEGDMDIYKSLRGAFTGTKDDGGRVVPEDSSTPLESTTDSPETPLDNLMDGLSEDKPDMKLNSLLDNVLRREGGFANVSEDKGGPTNYGITQKTLSDYLGRDASLEDVKALTPEKAKEIYTKFYLKPNKVEELPEGIQELVFDMNVLHGPGNAGKIVQEALNSLGAELAVDGVVGPQTLQEIKELPEKSIKSAINDKRKEFVENIVENDPSQRKFLKGWMNRLKEFV